MLLLLFTLGFLATPFLGAWAFLTGRLGSLRLSFGLAALIWAAYAVAATELLSIGAPHTLDHHAGYLRQSWLIAAWSIPVGISAVYLWSRRHGSGMLMGRARGAWSSLGRFQRFQFAAVVACILLTLVIGLASSPNNWDSMTYHLARVDVWQRLGGVVHYATNEEPQLYQPPGAEILVMQGYVLSGGDYLAATVQWFAYVGCIVLGSRMAALLGAGVREQLAAALLMATEPLAILEASSTQNDLVLSFWLLLAGVLAAEVGTSPKGRAGWGGLALMCGLALGMASLTKGTGLMLAFPIAIFLAIATRQRFGTRRTAMLAVLTALMLLLPNVGAALRNVETFGSPIATGAGNNPYRVSDAGWKSVVSNLVRNATNHMELPIPGWDAAVKDAVTDGLGRLGIDANDPRSTFLGKPFKVGPFGPHEDHSGSIVLLVLGVWMTGFVLFSRRVTPIARLWLGVVLLQVLLFSYLITWQNWHVRLHLPIVLAATPLIAYALDRLRRPRLLGIVVAVVLVMAPLYLFFNVNRPVFGHDSILTTSRVSAYFVPRPQLEAPYREAVDRISRLGIIDAGVASGTDDWTYPLAVLGGRQEPPVRFREVLVQGTARRYADDTQPFPRAVICTSCTPSTRLSLQNAGLTEAALPHGGEVRGRGDDRTTISLFLDPTCQRVSSKGCT